MVLLEAIAVLVVLVFLIQAVRLYYADGDLTLLWKERFGASPSAVFGGKVVWITGASSGIGECLAYELVKYGCKLVLSARREAELHRVKKQCLVSGRTKEEDIMVLPIDVLQFHTHKAAVEDVLKYFKQIDYLVNNAGRSQRAMIKDTDIQVDHDMLKVAVLGHISMTKAVLPHMSQRKSGHIVINTSMAGKMAAPNSASYSCAKYALHGWYECLRVEGALDNIRVTAVAPGPTFSGFMEEAFTGKPGEKYGQPMNKAEKRLTTARCAELIVVAIANNLGEAWMSFHPFLLFAYTSQYIPDIHRWFYTKLGARMITKLRDTTVRK